MNYKKPSKKAIGCMYIGSGILDIIFGVGAFLIHYYVIPERITILHVLCYIVIALSIVELLVGPLIRYQRYHYLITDECIDVKEGFVFIERNIVPIERLHKIRTVRGPIDRMFGLTKVIVTTAGGDVTIRFLEEEQANHIAESLQRRVNQIVVEQREEQAAMDIPVEKTEEQMQED